MQIVQSLIGSTAAEMEKLLSTKTVVGDPININGNTIIPLVAMGFGFGAGGGSGKAERRAEGEGEGGGAGGGGGIKPVAVVIINESGVRVEPVRGAPSFVEKIGEAVGRALHRTQEQSEDGK